MYNFLNLFSLEHRTTESHKCPNNYVTDVRIQIQLVVIFVKVVISFLFTPV